MIEIDGLQGGGQLLRTALALSLYTGESFLMTDIRGRRSRPGLMRQHLTAIEAARQVGDAQVQGAEAGSGTLRFEPRVLRGGNFHWPIGTAGSTTLVLQTILPVLWKADLPSTIRLEGGTHNPQAPCADFLIESFSPLMQRRGLQAEIRLERHGFYPAGGGELNVTVQPSKQLQPLTLRQRGELKRVSATALISAIPGLVAERELASVQRYLRLNADQLHHRQARPVSGPGNALMVKVESEQVCEIFTAFGEKRVSAERVAELVCNEARAYLAADVAVGAHLADQLLLPLALAGGGEFSTLAPTEHARTNAALIEKFLPVEIDFREEKADHWLAIVSD